MRSSRPGLITRPARRRGPITVVAAVTLAVASLTSLAPFASPAAATVDPASPEARYGTAVGTRLLMDTAIPNLWLVNLQSGYLTRAGFVRLAEDDDHGCWARLDVIYRSAFGRHEGIGEAQWCRALLYDEATYPTIVGRIVSAPDALAHHGGTAASWVAYAYQELLGRSPDPGGLLTWTAKVPSIGRFGVALGLLGSTEYARHVTTTYFQQWLGRAPDPAGLAYWADRVHRSPNGARVVEEAVLASAEAYALWSS